MQNEEQFEYEKLIMAWLRSKKGDPVTLSAMARRFKVGEKSITLLLNEMADAGKVRRTPAGRAPGFYIPTEAYLNAERRDQEESTHRPALKIDRHRAELYARLDAARASIRSIG